MKRSDKCCGGCTHFKYEDMDGWGFCELGDTKTRCSMGTSCKEYEDEEAIRRHHIAVLIRWMRWAYDYSNIYKQPKWSDYKAAIDFAIKFMRGEQ